MVEKGRSIAHTQAHSRLTITNEGFGWVRRPAASAKVDSSLIAGRVRELNLAVLEEELAEVPLQYPALGLGYSSPLLG
jgi:hypothetical protein